MTLNVYIITQEALVSSTLWCRKLLSNTDLVCDLYSMTMIAKHHVIECSAVLFESVTYLSLCEREP